MKYLVVVFLVFAYAMAAGQNTSLDSLNALLIKTNNDTTRINLMNAISKNVININLDSAIGLASRTITIARAARYTRGEAEAHRIVGSGLIFKSRFREAMEQLQIAMQLFQPLSDAVGVGRVYNTYGVYYGVQSKYDSSTFYILKALSYLQQASDKSLVSTAYQNIAINYQMQSNFTQSLVYYKQALNLSDAAHDYSSMAYIFLNISLLYDGLNDKPRTKEYLEKAIFYASRAGIVNVEQYAYANLSSLYSEENDYPLSYKYAMKAYGLGKTTGDQAITASSLSRAAVALAKQNKFDEAEPVSNRAILMADSAGVPLNRFQTLSDKGLVKEMQKQYAEAIPFYERAFAVLKDADIYVKEIGEKYGGLAGCYEATGNYAKSLAAYKLSRQIYDSLKNRENIRKATELSMNYEFEKKQQVQRAEKAKEDKENTIRLIFLIAFLGVFITLSTVALFAYRREQKAKKLVNEQKSQAENTLSELKITQAQLIHAEKMASLGELTAGIAHEIQNPLNFVNNFSEVNKEMLEELKAERAKPEAERDNSLQDELIDDVISNEEKIVHHGRRADAIVRGMLQHSRKNTGQKEPADINALCDEYLRLSYHGLRAKDKSFTADFTTEFDETMNKISVVPQDIGRVLLNLFNNAFYAVNERKKQSAVSYQPSVVVSTKKEDERVEIIVGDNGNGIPQNVRDKIFQPFFTTKPTGEGTGLGLSLSYDIITKEHAGTIRVESHEGEGTRFIITLPL